VRPASDLRAVLAETGFRRLLTTRLLSQLADGILQAGLASYVLFSPEQQATGARIAVSFAVLLLPYSMVGPFAGVLIDRWSRRQILVYSNVVRAIVLVPLTGLVLAGTDNPIFVVLALVSLGINRFFLAAMSASLPHVVQPGRLVTANALATTAGTVAAASGAGIGVGVRVIAGSGHPAAGAVVASAAGAYLLASVIATKLGRGELGPDRDDDATGVPAIGRPSELTALSGGVRYLFHRRPAWNALAALGVFRLAFGVMTVVIVLLQRTSFHRPTDATAGLRGVGLTFLAVAIGVPIGAALTPSAVRRWGAGWWIPGLMLSAAAGLLALGLPFHENPLIAAGLLFGVTVQGVKVCVDATVQRTVDDARRGLVFALYDVLFNVAFVVAAAVAALLLPPDGRSAPVLVGTAAALTFAGVWYWTVTPRRDHLVRGLG
jgi:MFS family permease